ncbi:hypothetical protein ABZ848_41620 [Streptomyces sp. NPDC047081]|uniref:hypothetical protein n=1 Tax=Streptomyces sp. NPDC047081 TaxID=3154706 RepID=UPI003401A3F4
MCRTARNEEEEFGRFVAAHDDPHVTLAAAAGGVRGKVGQHRSGPAQAEYLDYRAGYLQASAIR